MRQLAASILVALLASACAHNALPRTIPIPLDAALSMQLAPAARTLDSAIAAGAAPGAVLAVSVSGRHFEHAIGQLAVDDPRPPDGRTIYDMASLTKVVALTTLAMMAVEENRIALDSPVVHYLPEFAHGKGEKSRVLVRDLLLHDSGLPPDPIPPLWKHPGSRQSALTEALGANLDTRAWRAHGVLRSRRHHTRHDHRDAISRAH